MEIYVTGSLSYLNHRTNVDLNNRFVCYNTSKMGQGLKAGHGKCAEATSGSALQLTVTPVSPTRIFLDEFHMLPERAADCGLYSRDL